MPIENVIQPMAPINPMQDVQNYLTLLNQGQQLGVQQAEMDKRQAEIAQQQRYEQEQAVFLSNPNPTLKDAVRFMGTMSPEQQRAFSPVFDQIDEKELRSSLMFGGQLISALGSDPAVAQRLLKERIEAERNSGNTQAAMFLEQVSNQASTSPSNAMKSVTMFMSAIPGAGEYMSSQYSAGQEFRAQELAPLQQQSERALAGQRQASAAESMAGASLKQAQENIALAKAPSEIGATQALMQQRQAATELNQENVRKARQVPIEIINKQKGAESAIATSKENIDFIDGFINKYYKEDPKTKDLQPTETLKYVTGPIQSLTDFAFDAQNANAIADINRLKGTVFVAATEDLDLKGVTATETEKIAQAKSNLNRTQSPMQLYRVLKNLRDSMETVKKRQTNYA
ncbi:MAG: hypothetical protein ACKO37_03375, partial [Vampirovibrionales bacterium]